MATDLFAESFSVNSSELENGLAFEWNDGAYGIVHGR